MVYFFVILLLLFLSFRYDVNNAKSGKHFFGGGILILFTAIAGFRYRLGVDTNGYIYRFYYEYPFINEFSFEEYGFFSDPLFVLLNSIVKSTFGRFYVVQIIQSAFVNILVFRYIKKHSPYIFTSILFYFILCYFNYNMEIMRGSMSIAICLFANDYIRELKFFKGVFLYLIGCMFHAQTFPLLLTPLLFFCKFNIKGGVILLLSFFIGYVVQENLGNFFDLMMYANGEGDDLTNRGAHYANSDEYGEQQGNLIYFIIKIILPLTYILLCVTVLKYKRQGYILKAEPLLFIGVLFYLMQIHMKIAYRYVDYYSIYFVLLYSEFFISILKNNFLFTKSVLFVRSLLLFLPFFIVYFNSFRNDGASHWYYPYASIFEKSIEQHRENQYDYKENPNEY